MKKNDSLFDTEFTWLDAVKILLLVVTMFSTWAVVDIMTPDNSIAFVREIAAVGVVEGAFLGFEKATANAKSRRQVKFATIGFFCSLAVIVLFAFAAGLLEFGGEVLLNQYVGDWLGISWHGLEVVIALSLLVLVSWIGGLASIYRLYSLADPDIEAEMERISIEEDTVKESNKALKTALEKARPVVATHRAAVKVRAQFAGEFSPDELDQVVSDVRSHLAEAYSLPIPASGPFLKKEQNTPSPLPEVGGENS